MMGMFVSNSHENRKGRMNVVNISGGTKIRQTSKKISKKAPRTAPRTKAMMAVDNPKEKHEVKEQDQIISTEGRITHLEKINLIRSINER